ncbi:MAG: DUF3047 domain-containing protein [Candidatus Omnitrophica bacterium]|nr:DUF3047 domain-containing protein [Candidatus Omnitrophota bacterium]MDD5236533.1 DUF3047 domain-containing protein [Candidatus Omnitrophota bacterium]MDD5610743.1 DUF3047 domain-containing protein [Candidatus Omnitrophota bacterium]
MRKVRLIPILTVIIVLFSAYCAYTAFLPKLFEFDKKDALKEWEEKVFKGKVLYEVVPDKKKSYLLADSNQTCSGIFYKIRFNPNNEPMISWKWKVLQFPKKAGTAEGGWLEKDDYAARVYVIFPALIFTNIRCIEYVWDEFMARDTVMTSPYYGNIKIIVAESGTKHSKGWFAVERNVFEDYKKAFGSNPGEVGAIAIMTDADNSLSTAEAEYTDLKVGYKNE